MVFKVLHAFKVLAMFPSTSYVVSAGAKLDEEIRHVVSKAEFGPDVLEWK